MSGAPPSRFVDVDGCFNYRDLGGYRTADGKAVAWRKLYRSDGLHRMTACGSDAFAALGVSTVIDLRTPVEAETRAWTPPAGWSGRRLLLPLLPETPDWSAGDPADLEREDFAARHYWYTAVTGAAALRTAVEALAEPDGLPAVFHCAAGKDRTGVLAALVLRLLDVPAETIADDYALSDEATARWEASVAGGNEDDTQTAWAYVPPAMLVAPRDNMSLFLQRVEAEHGSVPAFAAHIGIGRETVERLRRALLDD
ncbi:tyrosine-protein phosphatase [Streptomyces sp. RerS4]|uniref:tyrosine-protein phosphatase n=1 Tax=Streptomyces sp. RerS4 TaxID=2942449 RepID=UPI00201BBF25|nr:tyrosine-protein phosphatase [Streptomyces sp. RerS4]UQX03464.1 tyrosine-protein phosphatase [Streptomyces sp. RerS4]